MEEVETGKEKDNNKIGQAQFYDLITGEEVSWQEIIYDLINSEQLDPWDIDISVLADKYLVKVREMEEADFFVSSKVLYACSLLLRLKSQVLASYYIQSLEELLYGKKEQKRYEYERIEIDENELPILVPKTPLPRYKKVTLDELMSALNQAMETETRRIKKEIRVIQSERSALIVMPFDRVNLRDRIKGIYARIKNYLAHPEIKKMSFSELAPSKDEKLAAFVPILHLSNQERLYLYQEKHFEEIYMMLEKLQQEIKQEFGDVEEDDNMEIPEQFWSLIEDSK